MMHMSRLTPRQSQQLPKFTFSAWLAFSPASPAPRGA
jgi:hypothetical protein